MEAANWKGMPDDTPFVNALLRQALRAGDPYCQFVIGTAA